MTPAYEQDADVKQFNPPPAAEIIKQLNLDGPTVREGHARTGTGETYLLRDTGNTPFFHHVASLRELSLAAESGELRTYHFNMMRAIMEKTASFHSYGNFADCIRPDEDDPDKTMYARVVNIMSRGNYSLYEPVAMMDENQAIFRKVLSDFRKNFQFNPTLFDDPKNGEPAA